MPTIRKARSQHLTDVPSFAEQGQADFVFADARAGIWVPVGLAKPIADRILSEVSKALHSAKFREGLIAQGFELPQDGNADQLRQQLVNDLARNKAIIERLKLNVNPELSPDTTSRSFWSPPNADQPVAEYDDPALRH